MGHLQLQLKELVFEVLEGLGIHGEQRTVCDAIQQNPVDLSLVFHQIEIHEHIGCEDQVEMLTNDLKSLYKTPTVRMKLTLRNRHN